jgi:two-component system, NarL family, sensor histidine kinase UhpB
MSVRRPLGHDLHVPDIAHAPRADASLGGTRRLSLRSPASLGPTRALPFAWRIFLVNAVILVAAALALALSPATVSFPIALTEGVVLTVGLVALLTVNLVLVRRAFAPLARLNKVMRSVDLLQPGQRVQVTGPEEVRELGAVFNEMLVRLERERRESGSESLKRQEDERKRVAQELHDEVGQALTAVMLQIGRASKGAPPELAADLREALETTRAGLEDVRRIARQLRPEALDDLGLVPALNSLATAFGDRTGLRIHRRLPEDAASIGDEAELAIFRIAQESLTNAARHAETIRIDLSLEHAGKTFVLRVRDYGRGLDGAPAGSGIRGMRERALQIGAELSIRSARPHGTEVVLTVPVEEER